MAGCPVISRLSWRTNYLLLLVICVCVVVWIMSLSKSHMEMREQVTISAKVQTKAKNEVKQDEAGVERMPQDLCPEKSPLLREFYYETTLLAFHFCFQVILMYLNSTAQFILPVIIQIGVKNYISVQKINQKLLRAKIKLLCCIFPSRC